LRLSERLGRSRMAGLMELAQPVGVLGRRTWWFGLDPLVVDPVVLPAAGCALRAGQSDLERAAVRSSFERVRV